LQKQISYLLSDIDQKISSQEILIQKLKNTKSALLIKMFPQENQSVPELRFDGFTNDWEQRKLKNICSIITKQTGFDYATTIKPSLLNKKEKDTYSFIQNKDFNESNINLDTDFYIPINIANRFPKIILNQPSLLISLSGKIGNVGLYEKDCNAFIGGAVGIAKLNNVEEGKLAMYELSSAVMKISALAGDIRFIPGASSARNTKVIKMPLMNPAISPSRPSKNPTKPSLFLLEKMEIIM
jgi:type I restriction enzyme S subunit